MNKSRRIVFGSGQLGGHHLLPEVIEAGWGHFPTADGGHLRPHLHVDAFELCFILSGEVEWATADGSYILRAGDVYITQPGEMHWGRDTAMHPCTLYWLIVGSPSCGFEWPGPESELSAYLDRQLRQLGGRRVRGTARLRTAFAEIFEEHQNHSDGQKQTILGHLYARTALHGLLIELLRVSDHQSGQPDYAAECRTLPAAVEQAIKALHGSVSASDVIPRICRSTGTNAKTLNGLFIEHLGTTISQYWLRQRVRLARARLSKDNITITAIATELGFSSSQHFSTVFRKVTGLTPSEYRRHSH